MFGSKIRIFQINVVWKSSIFMIMPPLQQSNFHFKISPSHYAADIFVTYGICNWWFMRFNDFLKEEPHPWKMSNLPIFNNNSQVNGPMSATPENRFLSTGQTQIVSRKKRASIVGQRGGKFRGCTIWFTGLIFVFFGTHSDDCPVLNERVRSGQREMGTTGPPHSYGGLLQGPRVL